MKGCVSWDVFNDFYTGSGDGIQAGVVLHCDGIGENVPGKDRSDEAIYSMKAAARSP